MVETNLKKKKEIHDSIQFIRSKTDFRPRLGLILGSGLGEFSENIDVVISIPASEIPHYPVSSVQGHAGRLVFGYLKNDTTQSVPLLIFQGRVHFYESGNLDRVIYPIFIAHQLGIKKLILTNAAGGLNSSFSAGDLMLIRDIINLTFLPGQENNSNHPISKSLPFEYFDSTMQEELLHCASELKIGLREGTYCWLKGPSYETPAEIQMLKRIGVDAVGMSTVPEIYAAASLGIKTVAISLISNLAAGISQNKLSHAEVTATAETVKVQFSELMKNLILSVQ